VLLYEAIEDEYMTLLHRVDTSTHHYGRNLELYSVNYLVTVEHAIAADKVAIACIMISNTTYLYVPGG